MAPALTTELLNPKEKLSSTPSPTATRQSSRKVESPNDNDTTLTTAGATKKLSTPTLLSSRVTRSKEAAAVLLTSPPTFQPNLKKKSINNNNSEVGKVGNEQIGLITACSHTTNTEKNSLAECMTPDKSVAIPTANTDQSLPAVVITAEHNNNCKDNTTAQLLADLTSDFEEAISAEICLRKTLPEVNLSKEPQSGTQVTSLNQTFMDAQSTSANSITNKYLELGAPPVGTDCETAQENNDNLEERLRLLDGSILVPVLGVADGASLASVGISSSRQDQQASLQSHTNLVGVLSSPQQPMRPSTSQLTPQSASSSINFLKDGVAGAVLEDQDIEEVLKALKTLDGGHVNPDTICDFNFFNEVCFLNNEEEASGAPGVVNQSNVSISLESDSEPRNNLAGNTKHCQVESHAELQHQQHMLQRKVDYLLRRMRKFQARQMCHHASEEIGGIFEWAGRTSNKTQTALRSVQLTEHQATVMSIVSGRPTNQVWLEKIKQPLAVRQLNTVMRHIQTTAKQQQVCHSIGGGSTSLSCSSSWYSTAAGPGKRPRKQLHDTSTNVEVPPPDAQSRSSDEVIPVLDNFVASELTQVAGLLHMEMREVQNAIDSDATDSSSGGESADEMVAYNNSHQQSLSITRRAVWRYSRDRAAIALRWSWLCTQFADLEMKIRQHNDLFNELNRTKGAVDIKFPSTVKNSVSASNGLRDDEDGEFSCSRSLPLNLSEFRKRKLFQTINMHTISKKAARSSNIKCGCQWPQMPCALCTGRTDPTAPRDLPETVMSSNRVAMLDSSYHSVLSFPDDIYHSVHIEAISRQPDWQYRVMRSQAKTIVKSVWKAEREALATTSGAGRRLGETGKRRYIRRKDRNNINSNSNCGVGVADIGNGTATIDEKQKDLRTGNTNFNLPLLDSPLQLPNQSKRNSHQNLPPLIASGGNNNGAKKQRNKQSSSVGYKNPTAYLSSENSMHQLQHSKQSNYIHSLSKFNGRVDLDTNFQRVRPSSPSQSGNACNITTKRNERSYERRNRMVYDIDNIVIPNSIAAATRVEILPYKEIPTPKWRVIKNKVEKHTKGCGGMELTPSRELSKSSAVLVDQQLAIQLRKEIISEVKAKATGTPTKSKTISANSATTLSSEIDTSKKSPSHDIRQVQESNIKINIEVATSLPSTLQNNHIVNGNSLSIVNGFKSNSMKACQVNGVEKNENNKLKNMAWTHLKEMGQKIRPDADSVLKPKVKRSKLLLKRTTAKTDDVLSGKMEQPFPSECDELEDDSDDTYILLHQQAMDEERRRFETFLKFPWSTQSRANRRVDSRAESSGANTPDPTSPSFVGGIGAADSESIPSPLVQYPLDGVNETHESADPFGGSSYKERRRTISSKLKEQERRSSTPDLLEGPIFETLFFPLTEEVYQQLLAEQLSESKSPRSKRAKTKSVSSNGDMISTAGGSRRSSKAKCMGTQSKISLHNNHRHGDNFGLQTTNQEGYTDFGMLPITELLDGEDDYPKHHLVPNDEMKMPQTSANDAYDACIDAYIGEHGLDETDEAEDPFLDDDPNDPEWKRSLNQERIRKRV